MKSSLTARRMHPWKQNRGMKPGVGEEVVGLLDVAVDEHVLPRHQHPVEDEDRVVLVQPAGERIVERAAHHLGNHLVGGPADQLHPRRAHRDRAHDRELLALHRHRPVVGDEVVVGERRSGRDDLGAADDDPVVALLLDVHEHVADVLQRPVAVDGRVDDRVVPVQDPLLGLAVPAPGVVLVGLIEVGVGAQRGQERRLVVGAAPQPPIAQTGPLGDRLQVADAVLGAARVAEELVGAPAAAGVGLGGDHVAGRGIVQRVVQPRDRPGGVTERRVRRDVLDPLAVDVHLPAVAQALQILLARQRPGLGLRRVRHLGNRSSIAVVRSGVTANPDSGHRIPQDEYPQPRRRGAHSSGPAQLRRQSVRALAGGRAQPRGAPARVRLRGRADRGGVVRRDRLPHPDRSHHRRQATGVHPAVRRARAVDAGSRPQPRNPRRRDPLHGVRAVLRRRLAAVRQRRRHRQRGPGRPLPGPGTDPVGDRRARRGRADRGLAGRRRRLLRRPARRPRRAPRARPSGLRARRPLLVLVGQAAVLPDPLRRPGGRVCSTRPTVRRCGPRTSTSWSAPTATRR